MQLPHGDGFDWSDDESIVCQSQDAIAVYTNSQGGIVIRQERGWDEDSDTVIVLVPECAQRVAQAIRNLLIWAHGRKTAEALELPDQVDEDITPAAARQKRYRERKRNGVTPDTVTRGVTELPLEDAPGDKAP